MVRSVQDAGLNGMGWDGIGSDQKEWNIYVGRIVLTASTFQGCCGSRTRLSLAVAFPGEGMDTKPSARIWIIVQVLGL